MAQIRLPSEVTLREFIATSLETKATKLRLWAERKGRSALAQIYREFGGNQKIRILEVA